MSRLDPKLYCYQDKTFCAAGTGIEVGWYPPAEAKTVLCSCNIYNCIKHKVGYDWRPPDFKEYPVKLTDFSKTCENYCPTEEEI